MIYIEVTNDLQRRVFELKSKQLKGWKSQKKVALIESKNAKWKDITELWHS